MSKRQMIEDVSTNKSIDQPDVVHTNCIRISFDQFQVMGMSLLNKAAGVEEEKVFLKKLLRKNVKSWRSKHVIID